MKPTNQTHRDSPAYSSIVLAALKSQLVMALSGIVLLLCFCGIAYSMDDPDSVTKPLSLCALFLSAFCGGFSAVRLSGDGLVSGLCAGGITALLLFLLSTLPVPCSNMETPLRLGMYGAVIASAAAGSVIGKKRNSRPKHRRN